MQGWQLVQRSANPENIRKEYEFLKRLRETEVMMTRVHPATSFVVKATAVGLFQAEAEERYAPQLTGLYLSQSVDCAMTSSDKVSLSGRVKNANGRGDGSFMLAWKKGVSANLHVQTSASVSVDSVGFSGRISKTLSERVVFILQPTLQYYHTMGVLNPSVMACKLCSVALPFQPDPNPNFNPFSTDHAAQASLARHHSPQLRTAGCLADDVDSAHGAEPAQGSGQSHCKQLISPTTA